MPTPREVITQWGQVFRWDGGDARAEAEVEADALIAALAAAGFKIVADTGPCTNVSGQEVCEQK